MFYLAVYITSHVLYLAVYLFYLAVYVISHVLYLAVYVISHVLFSCILQYYLNMLLTIVRLASLTSPRLTSYHLTSPHNVTALLYLFVIAV